MTGGKPFKFWPLDRLLLFGELVAAIAVVISVHTRKVAIAGHRDLRRH